MAGKRTTSVGNGHGPVRGFDFPRIALRQRTQDHPMAMFAVAAAACFLAMALIPTSGPAFAAIGGAPRKIADDVRTTQKTARLPMSETERACQGQAWGNESLDCLLVIAREAGDRKARTIRMIANAEPNRQTPNVF
ncbi:hypothetical protein [Mesorhizobium sp. L-8-3]|uniref:hypothetical protein n=1 Tax=Mesorhizobium sp. L-8-3 TaxID=2744522 RepID=UPI001926A458|nr:hypothetical protein [Mesorhizobium sp. L-8-3]BCH22601.1 hypothetical protein MesoLjLb_23860 [Mesorhizobium sp. L-8-3]